MESLRRISIMLPGDVAEKALVLAEEKSYTMSELIQAAFARYAAVERLCAAIASGEDRSEALDDFLMEDVVRIVHESRAELRQPKEGERIAS